MNRTLDKFFSEADFKLSPGPEFSAERANAILAEWVKENGVVLECHNEMTRRIWWKKGESPFGHTPNYSGILLDVKELEGK